MVLKMKRFFLAGLLIGLIAIMSACNMPGARGAMTPTLDVSALTPSQALPPGITPAYTETPVTPGPTATLDPGVTPTATVCTYWASWVEDVTVPDGTEFIAGTEFDKTWRLRSNGCLAWPTGTRLAFLLGDSMGGPANVSVPATAITGTADITVHLTAPSEPGEYTGYWQLQSPDGIYFGPQVWVRIVVLESTPTPTATPTPTPTQTPTTPDFSVSNFSISPDVLVVNESFNVSAILHNTGGLSATGVVVRLENHLVTPQTSCDDAGTVLYEQPIDLAAGASVLANFPVQINSAWHHYLCVEIDPANAIAEADEANNSQGQEVAVGTRTTIPLDAVNSGSVREDGSTSYPYAQPGDSMSQRVIGFLSWDLAPVTAGSEILLAEVTWATNCFRGGSAGDCTGDRDAFAKLGSLSLRAYYYGTLDAGDFAAAGGSGAPLITTFSAQPAGRQVVTESVATAHAAGRPFQLYLFFDTAHNGDGIADGLRFLEGAGQNTLTVIHVP